MGLKEVLEKMKLVELDETASEPVMRSPASPPAPPPPPRAAAGVPRSSAPTPPMSEVLRSTPPRPKIDEAAIKSGGKGVDVPDFPSIYQAAGVKDPPHGFSAYKVLEIFSSPEFAPLDSRAKAGALAGFLKMNPSGPVPIAHVIQDAVARDQALDGFEEFLRKKLDARAEELEKENAKLQAEIDEIAQRNKEKMDANRQALAGEKERFGTWQARKRIEERKLFDAISPFVEENPVTVGGSGSAAAPPADEA